MTRSWIRNEFLRRGLMERKIIEDFSNNLGKRDAGLDLDGTSGMGEK